MALQCPKCGNGTLKKGQKMVYCSEYKPKKEGDKWVNEGSCEFRITYKQKILKRALRPDEIKKIVEGEVVEVEGAKLSLDLSNQFFLKVKFGEKEEDPDL